MAPGLRRRCSSRAPRSALIPPPASTPVPARRVSRPALQMRKLRFQDAKSLSGIQVKIKTHGLPRTLEACEEAGVALETKTSMGTGCGPRSLPPGPPAPGDTGPPAGPTPPGRGGREAEARARTAGPAQTGMRAATPWLLAGRRGAGRASQVSGCPGPPSPLGHCQPRPHGPSLARPQEMPSLPRAEASQNKCLVSPTCPERESGHGCFLWSPPGPPQSLTVHPTSPTPGGTLLGPSCPARAPGSSRRARAYKPNLAVTGAGTPLRRLPVPSFPVCVPHEATRAGHGEAHRGPCKHVE